MHSVQHAGQYAVPQANFPLEIQYTHHIFALGVAASHRQSPAVGEHGRSRHGHPHDRAVFVCRVLDVGRCVVGQSRGRQPVLWRSGQVLRDHPMQTWPAFEGDDVTSGGLR